MEMDFPPSSTERAGMRPWGWKPHPSKDFRVVGDVTSLGEPIAFQQDRDKTEVEAPSSKIVLKTFFLTTFVMIRKIIL